MTKKIWSAALAATAAVAVIPVASLAAPGGPTASAATSRTHLTLHKGKLGRFIADGHGRTVYLFEKDRKGMSSCYGSCAQVWAPLMTTGKAQAGGGVKASKVGTTTRRGGGRQVTYGGWPLYYYAGDHGAGQTHGQGINEFGAKWYVVAASGKKIDND
jgi:predicted lipoprotein with Yx(FWY)xxD motif